MKLRTFIIVLNWNGWRDTVECVESLGKIDCPDCTVLIVDNGSTDGSERVLRERFPDIELLQTGGNLGFAGGMNFGVSHALGEGAEYVILLNNDTVVDAAFAGELLAAARGHPEAGILCSKIYFYDRPDVLCYAGAGFSRALGWGRLRGYGLKDDGRYDRVEETERPSGCSMMVTRRFCEEVGLLDERYFCYVEDTDWGMRAAQRGFRVLFVPSSKVWHKVSSSTGGKSTAVSLYYNVRNILLCLDKNAPLPFPAGLLRGASVLSTSLMSLFTMGIPRGLGIRRIYQGARDYLRGRFGEFRG
ncbi:MAG: glycosyltransferase family 2 protein [Thermodesulfobacteriota bacterium]